MQKDNRASNARYLGQVNGGYPDTYSSVNDPITEDQYQPTEPLFVEEKPNVPNYEPIEFSIYGLHPLEILEGEEQEPDPEELPDQDWAAQKTEYEL
jgi:hypothetical protein